MPDSHREENADVQDVVSRAVRGDEDAWRQILALYTRRVFGLVRARSGNDELAEEITQSVFVTVALHLGSGRYVEEGRFESWLFRVAMNRLRDEMRRRKRHAEPTDPFELRDRNSGSRVQENDKPDQTEALRAAISQLNDSDREIIELRHHAALSFRHIAEILSQPMGTVLARHHRALRKLRELIETSSAQSLAIESPQDRDQEP